MENKQGAGILFLVNSEMGGKYVAMGLSMWDKLEIFGGGREHDENIIDTAIREASEEFGLDHTINLKKYINNNPVHLTIDGRFKVYFVKVPFFDVAIPNEKARERLRIYNQLDGPGKSEYSHLVEMKEYFIIPLEQFIGDSTPYPIRDRDKKIVAHPSFNANVEKIYNTQIPNISLSWGLHVKI